MDPSRLNMSQPTIYDVALLPVLGRYNNYNHVDATGYQPLAQVGQSEGVSLLHKLLKVVNESGTEINAKVPDVIKAESKADEWRRYVLPRKYFPPVAYVPFVAGLIQGLVKVYDPRAEENGFKNWSPDGEFNFIAGRPHGLCQHYVKGSASKIFYNMGQLLSEEADRDDWGTYVYHNGQLRLYQRASPDSEAYLLLQYEGGLLAHQYVIGTEF